jgi:hypothetical protein
MIVTPDGFRASGFKHSFCGKECLMHFLSKKVDEIEGKVKDLFPAKVPGKVRQLPPGPPDTPRVPGKVEFA